MMDPYRILGISEDATDEQIKNAYKQLARKYQIDDKDSPMAEFSAEKMEEINKAYDMIMEQRRNGFKSSYGDFHDNYRNSEYSDVRKLIINGRIDDAELILNGVPLNSRDAEWYFLKGTVMYKKGWSEEAYNNFKTACEMDPNNKEYAIAMNKMYAQRSGSFGGFNPYMSYGHPRGCSTCDICTSLLCADCCCECCGGDFISCC